MICVEGDFVRTCRTGEGEFGRKRENIGVLAGFVLFLAGMTDKIKICVAKFYKKQGYKSIIGIFIRAIRSNRRVGNGYADR